MKPNLHLVFTGKCDEAFTFYEEVFGARRSFSMKYRDAPGGPPASSEMADKLIHISMPLGSITLMGCDSPQHYAKPIGGFQISVDAADEPEVRRLFAALSEDGSVEMPVAPTSWSPLFGMCTDKFGVGWMVGIPGPQPQA
jgi:PhnB protein